MSSAKMVKNIKKNYLKAITDEDFRENAISKNRYFGGGFSWCTFVPSNLRAFVAIFTAVAIGNTR
jgi:hypothetical protein